MSRAEPVVVAGTRVPPGRLAHLDLPAGRLPSGTTLSLPVAVVNGAAAGRRVWLSGAVHGDEINGVEICRRVLAAIDPGAFAGTLVVVPIVNVFGFVGASRYLPDRRDLNRAFPGSARGSLAARIARLVMDEVIVASDVGVDLHTGSDGRFNHPQVRCDIGDPETLRLATVFGAPLVVHAKQRDGSLRQAAGDRGISVLVHEAGEANRFDDQAIASGVTGVLRLLHDLGMTESDPGPPAVEPTVITRTQWVRARRGGILRTRVAPGDEVRGGQVIGEIGDSFALRPTLVKAPFAGRVIGLARNPLVNPGDAVANLGAVE